MRSRKIPNKLTAGGLAFGIFLHAALSGWSGVLFALQGALVGFGCLFVLYLLHALGAGDVKLFAAIGSLTGSEMVLSCIVYSVLFAGLAAVIILAVRRNGTGKLADVAAFIFGLYVLRNLSAWNDFAASKDRVRFPFMLAVAPGVVVSAAMPGF